MLIRCHNRCLVFLFTLCLFSCFGVSFANSILIDSIPQKAIPQPLGTSNSISGRVITPAGVIVPTVKMSVKGSATDSSSTGNYGTFQFSENTGGSYTLRPSKNNDTSKTNGLSVIDLLMIQSHVLTKNLLATPYKLIAADVNNDGNITTLDLLLLKRMILKLDTTFKGNRLWAFIDSSYTFPNPANPFPYKDSITLSALSTDKPNQTFIGVKLGDVSGDWKQEFTPVYKTDTLKVMAYNVLKYGDGCQGTTTTLNGYFKTIIQYANPDLLSLEKVSNFTPTSTSSTNNFAININTNVLNALYPNKYAFATPTNTAGADNMCILFYNKQKLSYLSTQTLISNVTDFDLYKLYYNDDNLIFTHDTTFLYVVQNHDQSGNSSTVRDQQITQEMTALRTKFSFFPNLINMGDFNTRSTLETCYKTIVDSSNPANRMYDPPFGIDKKLTYPADWDANTVQYKYYLTTSTRSSSSKPNSCGTNGGAKSWYDHIFLSPWLVNGTNYMQYVPNSYTTIGNDGNRMNVDVNSTSPVTNSSVPAAVADALWQLSNKFPITIKLVVKTNPTATSVADPN